MRVILRLRIASVFVLAVLALAAPDSAFAACGRPPENRAGSWCSVDGNHVRVWWSLPSISAPANGDQTTATLVRDEVEGRLWPQYEALLGRVPLSDGDTFLYRSNGGDGRYDIMLVNDVPGRYGASPSVFSLFRAAPPAKYSLVKAALPRTQLLATVAHELMHGFLSAFACAGRCEWLREATATWAEHFAYPRSNTEHEYATDFFANPARSLDDRPSDADPHQFGAYLFLFFLQHRGPVGSNNTGIVRSIWEASERFPDPLSAIDATLPGGFKSLWPEFIADNWNAPPMVAFNGLRQFPIYSRWDGLANGIYERRSFGGPYSLTPGGIHDLRVSLPHLSAAYYVFDFSSVDVRSVQLVHNMSDLRTKGVQGAELVIFIKVRGRGWQVASYDAAQNVRTFCRDTPDENLEQMVVVLGNSDPHSSPIDFVGYSDTPKVIAGDSGCLAGAAGYQECRVEIRSRIGADDVYQNVETQTWEISGPADPTRVPHAYPYRWTTDFSGSASKTSAPNWWANWGRSGSGSGQIEVLLEPITGGWQRAARRISTAATLITEFIGWEASLTQQGFSPINQAWNEMSFPKRVGPLSAPRIEGASSNTIDFSSLPAGTVTLPAMPGVGQPKEPIVKTSCRWSWPGL